MDRYRIEVGRDDGVKPGNIVGAVANEGGIDGEHIGPINIHDAYSTIDLPEGMPRDIFQTLQQTRVAGKQLRLSRATAENYSSAPRHGNGGVGRNGKPPRHNRPGGKSFAGGKGKKRKPAKPRS
jgi:ATP-dependent RNA helicase DeaD